MKTISEALAEQIEAIGRLYHAQELAKEYLKEIKKMQREWLRKQKEQIAFGWHKPVVNKPVARKNAVPNWHRIRSFCQRRRPPNSQMLNSAK